LSDIKSAEIFLNLFFSVRDRHLGDVRCESLQDGRAVTWNELLRFWWRYGLRLQMRGYERERGSVLGSHWLRISRKRL